MRRFVLLLVIASLCLMSISTCFASEMKTVFANNDKYTFYDVPKSFQDLPLKKSFCAYNGEDKNLFMSSQVYFMSVAGGPMGGDLNTYKDTQLKAFINLKPFTSKLVKLEVKNIHKNYTMINGERALWTNYDMVVPQYPNIPLFNCVEISFIKDSTWYIFAYQIQAGAMMEYARSKENSDALFLNKMLEIRGLIGESVKSIHVKSVYTKAAK